MFKVGDTVHSKHLGTTRVVEDINETHVTLLAPNGLNLRLLKAYVEKHYKTLTSGVESGLASNTQVGGFKWKKGLSAFDYQISGTHYTSMGIQPFEFTYANYGYIGLKAAVHTKVNKYLGRVKDNEIEQLKKARHCLDILIEKAELEANK